VKYSDSRDPLLSSFPGGGSRDEDVNEFQPQRQEMALS
jgi:hypothetical protein